MVQLKLILPTKKYEESYNSLIKEAYDYGDDSDCSTPW